MIPTPGGGNRLKSDPGMQKELKKPKNAANPYKPKGSQVTTTCVSIISGDINPPIVQIAIPNDIAFDLNEKLKTYTYTHAYPHGQASSHPQTRTDIQ